MTNTGDSPWLVRRIRSPSGVTYPRPILWGKVFASSETVAVQKFINTLGTGENKTFFDAVRLEGR